MAAFSLVADTNIDALTSKTGGDTYTTNGFTLTIDQDSRVGLNQNTSASLGTITVTAATGGNVNIDGRGIWMIPYTAGTGNVPAFNTVITSGTGSGKLIGVHASLTAASTATGAAMPATGFIRVKQKTGTYTAVALTGIAATASNAGRIGWLEIVGDESATINANRLGQVNITGAWYEIGTTNGTSNQTMQIPNNGLLRYAAGVYIETAVASGVYEFYANAGTTTTTGTEASRGKVVWIDANGLVRIGNSGAATNGFTPVTGLKVVIGNIFFENCTTAARTANVIPNATLATRYDFTTTGGGVVNIDKCNMAWYLSISQAYSCNVTNSCFVDAILLSEVASPMTFTRVGVGNKPTTALLTPALTMSSCYAGGTFTDCVWARVSMATANQYTVQLTDITGFTFVNDINRANTIQANATVYGVFATRAKSCTWTTPVTLQGGFSFTTCDTITITNTVFMSAVSGTTVATFVGYVWLLAAACTNFTISGLTLPVTNNQPFTALLNTTTGTSNVKLRTIGTYVSPLSLGSVNNTGLIYVLASSSTNIKIQRIYCSNTRTGIATSDNSCYLVTEENVYGDYADAVDVMAILNYTRKGMGGVGALTAQTSVYGTTWFDSHTSTTAGRITLLMNEANSINASTVTLTNGALFNSVGGLYMPTIGQTCTFEMPYYCIGHTSIANTALVMAGGTVANYRFEFSIDKNDGAGFNALSASAYTAATLATALNALTGISAILGFKLRLKVSTTTTNATAITSMYLTTVSSTTTQAYQYPLDLYTLSLTGLISGSDVIIYQAGTETVRQTSDAIAGTSQTYIYSNTENIDIGIFCQGYIPLFIRNYSLTTSNATLPIAQIVDRAYLI